MANTLMVGEKRDSQGWNVGGYAGSEFDVGPSPYFPTNYPLPTPPTNDPFLPMVFPGSFHTSQTHFVLLRRLGSSAPLDDRQSHLVRPDHALRPGNRQHRCVLSDFRCFRPDRRSGPGAVKDGGLDAG